MRLRFTKMHGLGNDFVVINAIDQQCDLSAKWVRNLSDRHFGVGFDQLLVVERPISGNADFRYRIFNADGGEVSQCGNGARCFARYVFEKGLTTKHTIVVDTQSGQLVLELTEDGGVTVNMGVPRHLPAQIPLLFNEERQVYHLNLNSIPVEFGAVSMGNPHAVIQVANVDEAAVSMLGAIMESHAVFPERANIGFMQIVSRQEIRLRVYERGAQETLACGSGACAAVVVGIEWGLLDSIVKVHLPGGLLSISWHGRGSPVFMSGPAVTVYEGEIGL